MLDIVNIWKYLKISMSVKQRCTCDHRLLSHSDLFERKLKKLTSEFCEVEITFDRNEPIRDFIETFGVDITTCYLLEPFKYWRRQIRNRVKRTFYFFPYNKTN
jgi:hypothetical protein